MPSKQTKLILLSSLLTISSATTAAQEEMKGCLYGFDYMSPDSAHCVKRTAINNIEACTFQASNGYTGDVKSYACEVSPSEAYIFFKDEKTCNEQLETMLANAP